MPKKFYRRLEQLLLQIDASSGAEDLLRTITRRLVESYSEAYGIESGRLYVEHEDHYLLIESLGEYGETIAGKTVPKSYPIIQELERRRLVRITPQSPGFDAAIEAQFTHLDNAAILVGAGPAYILSLGIQHTGSEQELMLMLEAIRTSIGLKLRQTELEGQLRQARTIQLSLLPRRLPMIEGFELAAATFPADEVGGDIYDVQRIAQGLLGIAIADASGHGLPAALQARDVLIGLRMGVARDQKITATIARLNEVIHHSGLASRFISLFYAELDRTGDIFYVNCGHCPPLLLTVRGDVIELQSTGPVLGPLPNARFRRGYAALRPGEYLICFTDGVSERKAVGNPAGAGEGPAASQEFGVSGVIEVARAGRHRSAKAMVTALIKAVEDFGQAAPWQDDVSVLVVRRLPDQRSGPD